jgi:hypothetical protein
MLFCNSDSTLKYLYELVFLKETVTPPKPSFSLNFENPTVRFSRRDRRALLGLRFIGSFEESDRER